MSNDANREGTGTQPVQILVAETVYAPEEIPGPVAVVIEGTKIREVWRKTDAATARRREAEQRLDATFAVTDLGTLRLAPGYIDLHTHGFQGHDVTTGSREDIESMACKLLRTGVTAFFPTIATTTQAKTEEQVKLVAGAAKGQLPMAKTPAIDAAEILGLRLEGPFISRAAKGAQFEPGIRRPDPAEMETLANAGNGWIRFVDFAPEEDQGYHFLATLIERGVLPCIGHTAATYEQVIEAIDQGARHSTHLFNAMSGMQHRVPGAAGALLTDNRVTIELIADGIHVHPAMIKLAIVARGPRDVALVTDAVAPAGEPEGGYDFVGRKVTVREGAVRLDNGALAGSILTLDCAVRNVVTFAGLKWSEAIRMATHTPARIAGMATRKGGIVPGMDADLVALDDKGFVQYTWTRGYLAYHNDSENASERNRDRF
ncbi:MAG: N-acetylglucosamine-6-phosphate deacetylase [Ktedonobacteraceae bacterium]